VTGVPDDTASVIEELVCAVKKILSQSNTIQQTVQPPLFCHHNVGAIDASNERRIASKR
jgi:hypothetical protein